MSIAKGPIDAANRHRLDAIDCETLMTTPLPSIRFTIGRLLPQGLHILAGAPKVGKSWLALWLCLCVAKGETVWKFPAARGDVLYLCLEDSYSRIQNRLLDITDDAPDNLYFATMSEKLRGGLEQQIERFLTEHPDTALIVIDTLQRIRSIANDVNPYASDYRDLGILKELADRHRMAILLIHHLRKMNDDDPMNASSRTAYRSLPCKHESSLTLLLLLFRANPLRWALPGVPENCTTGISGATDSNFVLRKDKRGSSTATLYCTGRDIEYRELTLEFDSETHIWNLLSDSVTTEPRPQDKLTIFLSEFLSERKSFTGTVTELVEALEKRSGEPLVPAALTKRLIHCREELSARRITFETHRTRGRWELRLAIAGDGSDRNDGKPDTGSVPNLPSQPSHLSREDA